MLMDVKFIYFIVILDIWAHTFIFHFSSPGKMLGFVSQREWNQLWVCAKRNLASFYIDETWAGEAAGMSGYFHLDSK